MPPLKQFQRSVYHLLLRSFIEILRLTNLETESSKQRTQYQHKWYTISLGKLAVECLKCAVLHFNFVSSFIRPKMDVMYQMSQICQADMSQLRSIMENFKEGQCTIAKIHNFGA